MKNAMQRLRKHNKKGFTLVELLVVLVILAILAAAIIPSMMGFIDRAKKESVAAECRSVLLAGQVQVNELYGKNELAGLDNDSDGVVVFQDTTGSSPATDANLTAIKEIADLPGTILYIQVTKNSSADNNTNHWFISGAGYRAANEGKYYKYEAIEGGETGTWEEVATVPAP